MVLRRQLLNHKMKFRQRYNINAMADNYLEKRYEEFFGNAKKTHKSSVSLDTLLEKNRSVRGYNKDVVVSEEVLRRIVGVNTKVASAKNQQVLRFRLVTRESGADLVLPNIKMGGALPELHLPFEGTEPEAFIVVCSNIEPNSWVYTDLGISLQSMLLKAVEIGLNGLIIFAFNEKVITEKLNLPYRPLALLAIGKSAEKFKLVRISPNDSHKYYRDGGVHYVPKIGVDDLII